MLPSTLYGAMAIHDIDTKFGKLYIVSELHDNPNKTPCNLQDLIAALRSGASLASQPGGPWKEEHDNSNFECWSEMSEWERILWQQQKVPLNPLVASAHIKDIITMNVRRTYPFHIIESLLAFDYFALIFAPITSSIMQKEQDRQAIYDAAKRFEKGLFEQIDHRVGLMDFVLSLIDPTKKMPKWYEMSLQDFEKAGVAMGTKRENPIHELMKRATPEVREKILDCVRIHVAQISDHSEYTLAARSMRSTRRTNSRIVFDKYEELREIFISIFGILMDVYILLVIMEKQRNSTTVMILGLSHTIRIFDFLLRHSVIEKGWLVYSGTSDHVDMKDRQPLARIQPPERRPIEEFQLFRVKRANAAQRKKK